MSLWQATQLQYVLGVLLDPGGIISLTDEQEQQLKLGKYVEEVPDPKALKADPESKKKIKVGHKGLVRASKEVIAGLEGKPLEDGAILYPPAKPTNMLGDNRGDFHATQFQNTR